MWHALGSFLAGKAPERITVSMTLTPALVSRISTWHGGKRGSTPTPLPVCPCPPREGWNPILAYAQEVKGPASPESHSRNSRTCCCSFLPVSKTSSGDDQTQTNSPCLRPPSLPHLAGLTLGEGPVLHDGEAFGTPELRHHHRPLDSRHQ